MVNLSGLKTPRWLPHRTKLSSRIFMEKIPPKALTSQAAPVSINISNSHQTLSLPSAFVDNYSPLWNILLIQPPGSFPPPHPLNPCHQT
ncbi:hypothetical protein CHARACLAT_010826 [Characodon lateralis]|uniref:Uncharacterized protein n=1 Tax=Characodon lateralis TaxID=208331 RepID=A0ABU7E123_9TELE|nr:hypothetical protein [Characodon lateralis]